MIFIIKYNYLIQIQKYLWKIKLIIILAYLFIIKYFLPTIQNNIKINELNYYLNNFEILVKKPSNISDNILLEEKKSIISLLTENKNSTLLNTIFLNKTCNFGNCIVFINKLIFYCEIIECKNIVLNKDIYWFITHNITLNIILL